MSWISLSETNIASYQAGGFVEAYKSAALADGQTNPLPSTIAAVVKKIRLAIANGGYALDADESKIPSELENDAVVMVVGVCKPRIAEELTDTERSALSAANALLMRIADGKFAPSLPDNPEAAAASVQSSGACKLVRPAHGAPQRSDYIGL